MNERFAASLQVALDAARQTVEQVRKADPDAITSERGFRYQVVEL